MRTFSTSLMLIGGTLILTGLLAVAPANAAWLSPDWQRRVSFHAADGSVEAGETFSDFTLVLELDATDFGQVFAYTDPAGQNLVITADDGETILDHEVVGYDSLTQTAEVWFRATELSEVARSFYLYFDLQSGGSGTVTNVTSAPGTAWSPSHLAVYHFTEDPSLGTLKDWGPNARDAVAAERPGGPLGPGWTSSNLVGGAVGRGWEFDGVDLYAYCDNVVSTDSSFTISAWFANSQVVDKGATAFQAPDGAWEMSFQRDGNNPTADFVVNANGSVSWLPSIPDADMHHYVWTLDADTDSVRFFLDGIERTYWFRYTPPGSPGPIWTGALIDGRVGIIGPEFFNELDISDGVADEFRLIEGVRSPGWIATEYRNQSDPPSFFVVDSVQVYSGGPTGIGDPFAGLSALGRITVAPNPFRGVANVSVETPLTDVTVQVYDLRGRLVRTLGQSTVGGDNLLRFLWDGRDAAGTDVSNGIYFIRARSGAAVATGKAMLVR